MTEEEKIEKIEEKIRWTLDFSQNAVIVSLLAIIAEKLDADKDTLSQTMTKFVEIIDDFEPYKESIMKAAKKLEEENNLKDEN